MKILLNLLAGVALLVWGTHIVRTGMLRVFGIDDYEGMRPLCETDNLLAKLRTDISQIAERLRARKQPNSGFVPRQRLFEHCLVDADIRFEQVHQCVTGRQFEQQREIGWLLL